MHRLEQLGRALERGQPRSLGRERLCRLLVRNYQVQVKIDLGVKTQHRQIAVADDVTRFERQSSLRTTVSMGKRRL